MSPLPWYCCPGQAAATWRRSSGSPSLWANPEDVLRELARVLKPGGIAGFCEPGPNHSKTAQSQFEMRNYTIVENDILMGDIWAWAKAAGSTSLYATVCNSKSVLL